MPWPLGVGAGKMPGNVPRQNGGPPGLLNTVKRNVNTMVLALMKTMSLICVSL